MIVFDITNDYYNRKMCFQINKLVNTAENKTTKRLENKNNYYNWKVPNVENMGKLLKHIYVITFFLDF